MEAVRNAFLEVICSPCEMGAGFEEIASHRNRRGRCIRADLPLNVHDQNVYDQKEVSLPMIFFLSVSVSALKNSFCSANKATSASSGGSNSGCCSSKIVLRAA